MSIEFKWLCVTMVQLAKCHRNDVLEEDEKYHEH